MYNHLLTCFGRVLTDTVAASVSSRRNRSNLKLFDRYSSLSSQLLLRHSLRVKMFVFTRELKPNKNIGILNKSKWKMFIYNVKGMKCLPIFATATASKLGN